MKNLLLRVSDFFFLPQTHFSFVGKKVNKKKFFFLFDVLASRTAAASLRFFAKRRPFIYRSCEQREKSAFEKKNWKCASASA